MTGVVYYTTPEVAERLRVKEERVRNWIKRGELIASNLGDRGRPRYRISSADLQNFLDGRPGAQRQQPLTRRRRGGDAGLVCRY